jgi:uncharacterized protein (TIGR02145 family)
MKETGFLYWSTPNTGADNSSGFSARPGGMRLDMSWYGLKEKGFWWSSTLFNGDLISAGYVYILYDNAMLNFESNYRERGVSIRCLKN